MTLAIEEYATVQSIGGKQVASRFLQELVDQPFITFVMRDNGDTVVYCKGLSTDERAELEKLIQSWRSA